MARVSNNKLQFARKLRTDQTNAEKAMWSLFRSRQLDGYKFRRQRVIGSFIVDFCCLSPKLIIELDGGQHQDTQFYDEQRTNYLVGQGFKVIRFWDNDVLLKRQEVIAEVYRALTLRPLPRTVGEGTINHG